MKTITRKKNHHNNIAIEQIKDIVIDSELKNFDSSIKSYSESSAYDSILENQRKKLLSEIQTSLSENFINTINDSIIFSSNEQALEAKLEAERCKTDILYFALNYCKILTSDGKELLKDCVHEFQIEFIKNFEKYNRLILMAGRQSGKTVTTAIILCWYMIFNQDKTIALVSKDHAGAKEILAKAFTIYSNLPKWLQCPVISWSAEMAKLSNNTRVFTFPAKSERIRGYTIDFLYFDEYAILSGNTGASLKAAVFPTVQSRENHHIIISSTPKGKNHFYTMYNNSLTYEYANSLTQEEINSKYSPEEFKAMFISQKVTWEDIPGRTEGWKKSVINSEFSGDEELFNQEYACEFLDSLKNGIFKIDEGRNYININPYKIIKTEDLHLKFFVDYEELIYYDDPDLINDKNSLFLMGVDVSEGLDQDSTVVNILRVDKKNKKMHQYFKFSTNNISPDNMDSILNYIKHDLFNDTIVYAFIENNQGGGGKELINNLIRRYDGWEEILFNDELSLKNNIYGVRSTPASKRKRIRNLKYLLLDTLIVYDDTTVTELRNYIKKGEKFCGNDNFNDDEVTSLSFISDFIETDIYEMIFKNNLDIDDDYIKKYEYASIFSLKDKDKENIEKHYLELDDNKKAEYLSYLIFSNM